MINQALIYLHKHLKETFLSVAGIVIAIGCILTVDFLSSSLLTVLNEQLVSLGIDNQILEVKDLSYLPADWDDSLRKSGLIKMVAGYREKYLNQEKIYHLLEVDPEYQTITELKLSQGRFFRYADQESEPFIAIVYQGEKEVGEWIRLGQIDYKVIGTISEDNQNLNLTSDTVLVLNDSREFSAYLFRYGEKGNENSLRKYLSVWLKEEDYELTSNQQLGEAMQEIFKMVQAVLSLIALISLLVALAGLAAVSYITGNQRIYEWGVRKSLGAQSFDIFKEILIENGLISGIGFILGTLLSLGLVLITTDLTGLPFSFSGSSLLKIGAFTLIAGFSSGIIPALKAMKTPAGILLDQ